MGKIYEGTHFVTAHKSPDLDTTIASFWGWLDAFAAPAVEPRYFLCRLIPPRPTFTADMTDAERERIETEFCENPPEDDYDDR